MDPHGTPLVGDAVRAGRHCDVFSSSSNSSLQSPGMSVVLIVLLRALLVTGLYMFAQHYLRNLRWARSKSSP
jgi:hypothetical protein